MPSKKTPTKTSATPRKPGRPVVKGIDGQAVVKIKIAKPKLVVSGVTRPRLEADATQSFASTGDARNELSIKQAPLTEKITEYMNSKRLNVREFAERIGTSSSYVNSIMQGIRPVSSSDPDKIKKIAFELSVPLIQIYIWAGMFGPEDLIVSRGLTAHLGLAFTKMQADPLATAFCPPRSQWDSWESNIQLRFVMLYEMAFQNRLLEYAEVEIPDENLASLRFFLDKKKIRSA